MSSHSFILRYFNLKKKKTKKEVNCYHFSSRLGDECMNSIKYVKPLLFYPMIIIHVYMH